MSTGTNSNFPKARTADLITERVGDELVVYDGKSSEAHCLSALAAAVFAAADGKTSPADLAAIASRQTNASVDVPAVEHALVELEDRGLIEAGGVSRRGFMQRSAAIGGAVVAGSLVTSVVAPAYGSTGSLPQGVPCSGFSSLAVQIKGPDGTLYGAHWSTTPTNGSAPNNWGATQANANCPTQPWTATTNSIAGVVLHLVSGGVCIYVPAGYTVVQYAAFFGKGAPGVCGSTQCITTPPPTSASCGYLITFSATCYQGC